MANSKKGIDGGIFGLILAGIAATIAAVVGFNELSKSKSGVKGNTMGGYNSVRAPDSAGNSYGFSSTPKKSGCGCSGGA